METEDAGSEEHAEPGLVSGPPGGVIYTRNPVDPGERALSITAALGRQQVIRLARKALDIEKFYAQPQDIEWAMQADGTFFILQCRPLAAAEAGNGHSLQASASSSEETLLLQGGITASAGAVGVAGCVQECYGG